MNILVTGANGQLGNEMRIIARESDDHYVFTDVNQVEGVETGFLDITDLEAVRKMVAAQRVDVIVNCAAYTNVDMAESNEELVEKLNAEAPENLAKVMKETNGFLVQISTDYVFGKEPCNVPCQEDQQGTPTGVYGMSKLHGEQKIQAIGCKHVIIRTAWLYSEYGNNFMKTVLRLGKERDELRFIFDQVGTPTYAGDLAVAMLTVLERAEAGKFIPGIYHFSDEGVCSWYDFTVKILQIAGMNNRVIPIETKDYPTPASRPHYSVLNKGKIKSTYGLTIPHWETSLAYCMNNKV